jgi:DNA-binding response OmpR family regulator
MGQVLIVEDDPVVGSNVREYLQAESRRCTHVASDRSAYNELQTHPDIETLIVDINLGEGTTGYDIARFARRVLPEVRVIYMSGETSRTSFDAFGVPGGKFLTKPVKLAALIELLED